MGGDDVYVSIPADEHTIQASPPVATSYAYYVIPSEPRQQRKCGGACCCICGIIGLLLFFLIPRQPSVSYQYLAYNGAYNASNSHKVTAADFTGKYRFENMNYYSVDWKDLRMKSYWLTGGTTNCDMYKTKYGYTYCAKEMGAFNKKEQFSTPARSRSTQNIPLSTTAGSGDGANLVGMLAQCFVDGSALVMSSGSVYETTGLHDFGKVSISDQYFYLICN